MARGAASVHRVADMRVPRPLQCVDAMRKAGFEIEEVTDLADDPIVNPVPWYGAFWRVQAA